MCRRRGCNLHFFLSELYKSQHFTQWRRPLFLHIFYDTMNSEGFHLICAWLSVGQLDLLQPRIECLIPDGAVGKLYKGSVQLHLTEAVVVFPASGNGCLSSPRCLSTLASALRTWPGQLATPEGPAAEGGTKSLYMARDEDVVLNLFQELRSVISCLIVWTFGGVQMVLSIGQLKGLSGVSDNALNSCLALPGVHFPLEAVGMLEFHLQLFHCSSASRIRFFSPALTKIHTYDSRRIRSESFAQGGKKKKKKTVLWIAAGQPDCLCTSVYGCKSWRTRWGQMRWHYWGRLSVWVPFDAAQL